MIAVFPLARSKRAGTLARQVMACRQEKRQKRLDVLLGAELEKLLNFGIDEATAQAEVVKLRDRTAFIMAAFPAQWGDAS